MQREEEPKELEEEEGKSGEQNAKEKEGESENSGFHKEDERAETISAENERNHLKIPVLNLSEISKLEVELFELSKEIPEIEKEKRSFSVPTIEFSEPSLMLSEYELDYKIPQIEKNKKLITIPMVKVNFPPKLFFLQMDFDAEIRKSPELKLAIIRAPIYHKAIFTLPKPLLTSLDLTINNELKRRLEAKEKVEIKLPVKKVETEIPATKEVGHSDLSSVASSETKEEENILDELIQPIKGGSFLDWKIHRPLCIILTGNNALIGMKMIEDIMSTKYTYHGFYEFLRLNLPWQSDIKKPIISAVKSDGEKEKTTYEKIISQELIISDAVTAEKKEDVIRGLRNISHRGAKCVIIYVKVVEEFEKLPDEVAAVDFKFISLPDKLDDRIVKLMGKVIGVELQNTPATSIDELWHRAIRLYEEEAGELDKKLPYANVPYFPERESTTHYLMKRLVYNWLNKKDEYKNKIKVEKPLQISDDEKIMIPDITVENGKERKECWEVETGYPFKDEQIIDRDNPFARLVSKIQKYREQCNFLKIHIVVPSIYAHMFKEKIMQTKKYFKQMYNMDVKFYTIQWYQETGIKFFL